MYRLVTKAPKQRVVEGIYLTVNRACTHRYVSSLTEL